MSHLSEISCASVGALRDNVRSERRLLSLQLAVNCLIRHKLATGSNGRRASRRRSVGSDLEARQRWILWIRARQGCWMVVKAPVRGNDRDETCCRSSPRLRGSVKLLSALLVAIFTMLDAGLQELTVMLPLMMLSCSLRSRGGRQRAKPAQRRTSLSPHVISFTTNPI